MTANSKQWVIFALLSATLGIYFGCGSTSDIKKDGGTDTDTDTDTDSDTDTDTDSDTDSDTETEENTSAACQDDIDNDGDGDTDCDDSECEDFAFCDEIETDCDNDIDDDGDGATDCEDEDCEDTPECGGDCYGLEFLAPAIFGQVLTEANDDADPDEACVQYAVIVQATSPIADTEVCLFIDSDTTPIGCVNPNVTNPMTFDVTLCQGEHTLNAEIDTGDCDPESVPVTVWENPSCAITTPALSEDSADPTPYNQDLADIEITTNGAHAELWVGGSLEGDNLAASGIVAFDAVDLGADGDIVFRARCYNAGADTGDTWSPYYYVEKDTVAPSVLITSPSSGAIYGSADCPFTVTVTGIEPDQTACAAYEGQTPLDPGGCAVSSAVDEEIDLLVACIDGTDLTVNAFSQDSFGNVGSDSITVSADTGVPTVLIQTPANSAVYNKSDDTIDPGTDAFEHVIIACTDGDYDPANISLTIDSFPISSLNPIIAAASCGVLTHQITFDAYAFTQSPAGTQTEHTISITVSDGLNVSAPATSTFNNDTIAPELTLVEPSDDFFSAADDNCTDTPAMFEVATQVEVSGLEAGQPVPLTVTNGGVPVGASPYSLDSTGTVPHYLYYGPVCGAGPDMAGVELANGQNLVEANATDQAGNVAIPAQHIASYGAGVILSPLSNAILSAADDSCDTTDFGFPVDVEVDENLDDDLVVEVTVSSAIDGWSHSDTWDTDCSTQPAPCDNSFCIVVPNGEVEQNDITVTLTIDGTPVPGGPTAVTVDLSAPGTATDQSFDVKTRRAAEITLSWDSVEDTQTGLLTQWDVRCVVDATISLGNWDTAMQFAGEPVPLAAGQNQTFDIAADAAGNKIRAGHAYSCGIRGQNAVGLWSDIAVWSDITDAVIGLLQYGTVIEGYSRYDYTVFRWPSIVAAGNLDGDDYDDMLIGFGGTLTLGDAGAAIVFGSSPEPSAPFEITCADGSFGGAMAGIGDFDGDLTPDFAIASPDQDKIYIFRGDSSLGSAALDCTDADVTIVAPLADYTGNALASGNYNNDAYSDLIIGAPLAPGFGADGAAWVVYGRDEDTWPITIDLTGAPGSAWNADGSLKILGETGTGDYLGDAVASWDFDKNGAWEVIVGIAYGASGVGTVGILAGDPAAPKTADTVIEKQFSDLQIINFPVSTLPEAARGLGITPIDFDSDGWVDLAVGGHIADIGGPANSGDVIIFENDGAGNILSSYIADIHGDVEADSIGRPIGGVYNMSLDVPVPWKINGVSTTPTDPAIFVGAQQYDPNILDVVDVGFAALWYGEFTGARGTTEADILFSPPAGSVSYHWAAVVGDLNNDGYADLAVGDPMYGSGGRILLYY